MPIPPQRTPEHYDAQHSHSCLALLDILLAIATVAVLVRCFVDNESGIPGLLSLFATIAAILAESFRVYAVFKSPHRIRRLQVQVFLIASALCLSSYILVTSVTAGWHSMAILGIAMAVIFVGFCAYANWRASQMPPYEPNCEDARSPGGFEAGLYDCVVVGNAKESDSDAVLFSSPETEMQIREFEMENDVDEQRIGNLPVRGELAFPDEVIEQQRSH
jgi:hypothetical protein